MRLFRHGHDQDSVARPVLLVEDDDGLRAYLEAILEEQGHRVIAAGMLAVLDVGLPGMDGFAVAEQLAPDVPVIVVTGDPLRAKMRAYGRASNLTILAKPITAEQFHQALQAAQAAS
jgi:CheY-like chemotaxis protein